MAKKAAEKYTGPKRRVQRGPGANRAIRALLAFASRRTGRGDSVH